MDTILYYILGAVFIIALIVLSRCERQDGTSDGPMGGGSDYSSVQPLSRKMSDNEVTTAQMEQLKSLVTLAKIDNCVLKTEEQLLNLMAHSISQQREDIDNTG